MCKVTFRKTDELLTSMFTCEFKSEKAAKAFITKDAEHYAAVHGFGKNCKLVNEDPDCEDYFILYRLNGAAKRPELVYQYFNV